MHQADDGRVFRGYSLISSCFLNCMKIASAKEFRFQGTPTEPLCCVNLPFSVEFHVIDHIFDVMTCVLNAVERILKRRKNDKIIKVRPPQISLSL